MESVAKKPQRGTRAVGSPGVTRKTMKNPWKTEELEDVQLKGETSGAIERWSMC